MENKKGLKVSAAICDVRSVTEETLAAYERVSISCAALITCPEARAMLARYPVEIETASTMDLEKDVGLSVSNGKVLLTPGQAASGKTALMVNGMLDIAPGCEEVLQSYAAMHINGSVIVPESLAGKLSRFTINGSVSTYPDGCIRLSSTKVLDRTFPLRAKQDTLYYAASRIVALDGDIGFGKLAEKNVRFATKKLIVAEGLVEAALPLFDEKTDIQILPDGCAYVDDDLKLTESAVRRYGGKLYVDGDLILLEDGPWLDQVAYLRVDGDVLAAEGLADRVNAMDAAYETLYLLSGTPLIGVGNVHLTRGMLENAEDGLSLVSCGSVMVDKDIPVELLREKLLGVIACGNVGCTGEQQAVIELVAQDTGNIGSRRHGDGESEDDPNLVKISAATYTL